MTTAMGTGRPMTSPPLPGEPGGNRALRIALLAVVALVAIGGLIAVVVLVPAHKDLRSNAHPSIPAPSTQLPSTATAQPSASKTSAPTSPAPVSSLGGLQVSPADPQAALKSDIAAAFVQYIAVENDLYTTHTKKLVLAPLVEVAADPLLSVAEDAIAKFYGSGHLQKGRSKVSGLTITSISPDGQSATVNACEDSSSTEVVDATTGSVIFPAKPGGYIDAVTMRVRNGRWKATGLTHPDYCK